MRSALKSAREGVVPYAVVGVGAMFKKDAEVARTDVMEGRRPRPMEGRRRGERGERGEREAGDPGCTWAAQVAMAANRRGGGAAAE